MPTDNIDQGDHDPFLENEYNDAMGYNTTCRKCGCGLTDDGYCLECEDAKCRD